MKRRASDIPETPDEGTDVRLLLLQANQKRMQRLAWKFLIEDGNKNTDMVLVCIEVYSIWHDLVESVAPDYEEVWQELLESGHVPNAIGPAMWNICPMLARQYPHIAEDIMELPEDDCMKGFIMTNKGCLVTSIEPRLDRSMMHS